MTFKVGDYGWVWDGTQWTSWRNLTANRDQERPLLGCTLFIWINRVKVDEAEILQNIDVLGGKVAKFLDDSISFVVTDQDPTKVACARDSLPLSRGQLILSKVQRQEHDNESTSSGVLDKVKDWRIKLWNVSQFLRWIEVHLNIPPPAESSRKRKSCRLPRPLVKLEDEQQEFKPVYKVFKSDPSVYVNPLYPASPFDDPVIQDRYVQLKKTQESRQEEQKNSSDASVTVSKEIKDSTPRGPPKQQYCEVCNGYFYNLQQHITTQHREFGEDSFECVKELIDCFPAIEDFMGNADNGEKTVNGDGMHPSAYLGARHHEHHLSMLSAATYRGRPGFEAPVMVKQEPMEEEIPPVHPGMIPHPGLPESATAVPLDFSRTSHMTDGFARDYTHPHHHPGIAHQPYLPDKEEASHQPQCWLPKLDGHPAPPPPVTSHLPLENFSFLDQPHQDSMFTSEMPQPDFSFGLQNLLHSICDETEDEAQRRGGTRSIDSNKENVERAAEAAGYPSRQAPTYYPEGPPPDPWQFGSAELPQAQGPPPSAESSSSPLELTTHTQSEPSCSKVPRRRNSRGASLEEDPGSNGLAENNPNRWTVERTRRGVGLKLRFTPARKQSSSLMSPPPPVTPREKSSGSASAKGSRGGGGGGGGGGSSSSFDVYDWNDEDDGPSCDNMVKMQWRVLHTEDTKVILCRTKQFALPRKSKHAGGKQLVF
ncbi:uncharacterized protein LOC135401513 [Ornithodoros turicata]|uniref:Protein kinase essential for the initiation of dna replication n=1 Tax=Ornithodoros turicata TaxID=34597 RepID=A0A2R5LAG4_9ACAR